MSIDFVNHTTYFPLIKKASRLVSQATKNKGETW